MIIVLVARTRMYDEAHRPVSKLAWYDLTTATWADIPGHAPTYLGERLELRRIPKQEEDK